MKLPLEEMYRDLTGPENGKVLDGETGAQIACSIIPRYLPQKGSQSAPAVETPSPDSRVDETAAGQLPLGGFVPRPRTSHVKNVEMISPSSQQSAQNVGPKTSTV